MAKCNAHGDLINASISRPTKGIIHSKVKGGLLWILINVPEEFSHSHTSYKVCSLSGEAH